MDHLQTIGAANGRSLTFVLAMALLPAAIMAGALRLVGDPKVMPLSMVIMALVVPIFVALLIQLFLVRAKISDQTLTVGGGLYSLALPKERLLLASAKIVPGTDPQLAMRVRTNGIGMPGLRLGWFTQRSGKRVFLAVSDHDRVVVVPTELGYEVLLSPENPEAFLEALRAW